MSRPVAPALALACALTSWSPAARADLLLPDPDVTPPMVTIVAPADGEHFDDPATTVVVVVEALDLPGPRGDPSSGVSEVWLDVDGTPQLPVPMPYMFELTLGAGSHTLRAHATDYEGNTGDSATILITLGSATDGTTTLGSDSGASGSGGPGGSGAESAGEADTGPSGAAAPRGCACGVDASAPTALVALSLVLVRRRRRATHQ